jgi:hypothetical protein
MEVRIFQLSPRYSSRHKRCAEVCEEWVSLHGSVDHLLSFWFGFESFLAFLMGCCGAMLSEMTLLIKVK